ncbi:MAG: NACHT domain-containing protein, partial [Methylococcales bacterium]|nr:NACHT domain-containing protein [Methylococcales bacterium]
MTTIVGAVGFLDMLSGAHALINPSEDVPVESPPAQPDIPIKSVVQQTVRAIFQQLDPQKLTLSPAELQATTKSYLNHLVDRYQILDFKGMGVDRVVPLPLLDMYVPLKARVEMPRGETWQRVKVGGGNLPETENQGLSKPQPVLDLIQKQAGLIILGDPGAGKTTLLKTITLRLALGQGEAMGLGTRLPILLPLSAYAKALSEKEIPLDDFFSQYYQDLGSNLPLTPLLDDMLAQGQVLFLMDGLDEVRSMSQRSLVVDRFLTYFSLHHPAGNKFVLTSRIIGYDAVRPANDHLRDCTLVDFEWAEIVQFVNQWTTALEQGVQGGQSAVATADAHQD